MSTRPHIVRSISLDTELALWVEQQAAGENRSVSNFVNTLLGRLRARAAGLPPGIRISHITPTVPPPPGVRAAPVRKPARVGEQEAEVGGQRSEVRGQRSEVRGQ
jgi:hypothetical protein